MSGSIRQEPNGTFTIQFWFKDPQTGKRQNVKRRGFATKRKAQIAMRELQVSFDSVGPEAGAKLSVSQYLKDWFDRQAVDKAPATNDRYRNAIERHIEPALGGIGLVKLSVLNIDNFLALKLKSGLSEETVNGFYRVLNTALKDAVRWGYLNKNPAELVSPPKAQPAEKIIMSSDEQARVVAQLLKESHPEHLFCRRNGGLSCSFNTVLFHLAVLTGLRRGELAGLQFDDIDEEAGAIHVRRSISQSGRRTIIKRPKTQRGMRRVVIDQRLMERLIEHREQMGIYREQLGSDWNTQGWLFASADGSVLAPRALNSRFSKLLERSGLGGQGYNLHTLRHTHISQLLMSNAPPLVVSRRAGHASVATTMNLYGHVISQIEEGVISSRLEEIQRSWAS